MVLKKTPEPENAHIKLLSVNISIQLPNTGTEAE